MKVLEQIIVASRGRNKENPSDRTPGAEVEQRLEPNSQGVANTLTSVQKDNYVLGQIYQSPRGNNKGGLHNISPTITSHSFHENNLVISRYRIRKLIPRETWRLMDFTDEDFEKAEAVNSNSQLYKEAGNSIVKAVMMALMSQLNIKGVIPWNER